MGMITEKSPHTGEEKSPKSWRSDGYEVITGGSRKPMGPQGQDDVLTCIYTLYILYDV